MCSMRTWKKWGIAGAYSLVNVSFSKKNISFSEKTSVFWWGLSTKMKKSADLSFEVFRLMMKSADFDDGEGMQNFKIYQL